MIRLRDAASNITATVGPAEGLSPAVQSWIQSQLTAQGIDPAAATPAQINASYTSFANSQSFANLSPVYPGSASPPPQPLQSPLNLMPLQPLPMAAAAPQSPLASVSAWPWWYWAAGAGAILFLSGRK